MPTATASSDHAPATDAMTHRPWLVVYDGLCGFCERSAHLLARWDRNTARLAILPHTDPRVGAIAPHVPPEEYTKALQVVRLGDGAVFAGADGIEVLLRRALPWGRWLAWPWSLPFGRRAARAVYALIARNRRRLGCDGACAIT